MAEPLPLPYDAHPAFRTDGALDVPAADVEAFAAAYSRLERGEGSLAQRRDAQLTATTLLARLFDELRTDDADVAAFVADLRTHVHRLLAADIEHFLAQGTRSAKVDDRLAALDRERFFFGTASAQCTSALADIARTPLEDLRRNVARGKVTREDLSINQGAVPAAIVRVLDKEFERQGINDVVSTYMRRAMRVTGVALELSVPTATWWRNQYELARPPRTLYAHTDEGLANPKSIVYLTDVDLATGPMSVFPHCEDQLALTPLQKLVGRVINSVGQTPGTRLFELYGRAAEPRAFASPAFRRHFAMLPHAMRYNSHFGWDVVPESSLERALVAAEKPLLGPSGTFVVFDGARVIHRGGMVERGERVALQVVFSIPPSRLAQVAGAIARGREVIESRVDLKSLRQKAGLVKQRLSRHPHDRLVRAVADLLPPLACVDIGASYYPHPPWEVFRSSPNTTWVAVEPNPQNTAYLDDWHWPSKTRLCGYGLSEHGGEQTLHVTHVDSGSSLLPPVIADDMAHRVTDRDYFFPVTEKRIATKSLAELDLPDGPLVIKLDTQGTELAILRGGARIFDRIVGIETEATLLAKPVMAGSGKFWEVCQFLEARGFELLQLKPIEGGTPRPGSALERRTYLNECDAVFCLTRSELAKRPPAYRLAALGFYLSYHLYDEARSLLDTIDGNTTHIRELLDA